MSTTMIIIVGALIVVVLLAIIYISNSMEQARAKRQLLIHDLVDGASRILRLVDDLPNDYLDLEIRLEMMRQAQRKLAQSAKLSGKTDIANKAQDLSAEISNVQSNPSAIPNRPVKTDKEAQSTRAHIKDVANYITKLVGNRQMKSALGRSYLDKLNQSFAKVGIQLYKQKAALAEQKKQYSTAATCYKQCVTELESCNSNNVFSEEIKFFKEKTKQAQQMAAKSAKQAASQAQASEEKDSSLDEMFEDDPYKKKRF